MKNRVLRGSVAFAATLAVLASPIAAVATEGDPTQGNPPEGAQTQATPTQSGPAQGGQTGGADASQPSGTTTATDTGAGTSGAATPGETAQSNPNQGSTSQSANNQNGAATTPQSNGGAGANTTQGNATQSTPAQDSPAQGSPAQGAPAATPGTVTIDLFNLTDIHGRLVERSDKGKIREAGLAAMQCYMEAHPNANKSLTLLGDNIGASTFESGSQKDNPVIAGLNLMRPLASTIGNHEFDAGKDVLKKRIDGSDPEYLKIEFPYLGANVEGMGTYGTNTPYLGDYVIKDFGGVKVAYIGAIADDAPAKLPPSAITGLTFNDPHPKLAALAKSLKAEGKAHIVVAMLDDDVKRNYSRMPAEVDVLMGGDTHKPYEFDQINSKEKLEAANPHLAGVASGAYTDNLGLVTVTYDTAAKKVTSADAKVIPAADVVTAVKGSACMENSPIAGVINQYIEKAKPLGAVVVGENVPADFTRGKYTDAEGKTNENRGAESTVGNLVADAFHKEITTKDGKPVDLGVTNAGGLRSDLKQNGGVITVKDVFGLAPFSNYAAYREMTGAVLKQALENQWTELTGSNSRPFLRLATSSNVTYTYDASRPAGERITSILINGKPLDPAATYTVGSTDFILNNAGDRYFAKSSDAVLTGELDRDVIARHITKESKAGKLAPSTLKRGVGITLPKEPVSAGTTIDIALRGLSFSSGAMAKDVTVKLGDTSVTAAVDNSILETTPTPEGAVVIADGVGQATVKVPVKADLAKVCAAGEATAKLPLTVSSELGTHVGAEAGLTVAVKCPEVKKPEQPGADKQQGKAADKPAAKGGKQAGKGLAATGASADVLALGAGLVVALGAGALGVARRRR